MKTTIRWAFTPSSLWQYNVTCPHHHSIIETPWWIDKTSGPGIILHSQSELHIFVTNWNFSKIQLIEVCPIVEPKNFCKHVRWCQRAAIRTVLKVLPELKHNHLSNKWETTDILLVLFCFTLITKSCSYY